MNDIRQVTNFSQEVTSATTETLSIYIGNKEYISVDYYILPISILTGSLNTPINKLGYVCEPRGIDYPIVITAGDERKVIYLGKTGMFEIMPETFTDINDDESEEIDCTPQVTQIEVPKGVPGDTPIKFKLDYTFSIN